MHRMTITEGATFIERTLRLPMPHAAPLRGLDQPTRTLAQAIEQVRHGRERFAFMLDRRN